MRAAVPFALVLCAGLVTGCGGGEGEGTASFEERPWVLVSGIPVPQDVAVSMPSATFDGGTVGGSTGCNRYTAEYTVDGDALTIGQMASTQMACLPPADRIERDYVSTFARVVGWRLEGDDLVLVGSDDAELLRYAPGMPVGSWQVTAVLRGDALVSPLAATELTATFGADGKLNGSAGCNSYMGSYTFDGGAIEIAPPAATRKACGEPEGVMEQEAAYLALLPQAVGFRVDGRALRLESADGAGLVVFTRAD